MGKSGGDFLSPKAIANRIKAKGLQRLRWYCQMCEKQCRDENGFQCHLRSEAHARQMQVFAQNPDKIVEGYSQQFEKDFLRCVRAPSPPTRMATTMRPHTHPLDFEPNVLTLLRHASTRSHFRVAHPHKTIAANVLYNEFIADRNHVHMNATKWLSLTSFVAYLGRTGKCKVEETDKGWFIALIHPKDDRDAKRKRKEADDEARHERALRAQIARASSEAAASAPTPTPLSPHGAVDATIGGGAPAKVAFTLGASGPARPAPVAAKAPLALFDSAEGDPPSTLAASSDPAAWLVAGLVVRERRGARRKLVVSRVHEGGHAADLMLASSSSKSKPSGGGGGGFVRLRAADVETVIPNVGRAVRVVKGPMRGRVGRLLGLDQTEYKARVCLDGKGKGGETGEGGAKVSLEYDEVCKIQAQAAP